MIGVPVRTSRLLGIATIAALAIGLSACATPAADTPAAGESANTDSAFPVTIEHVYGSTTIESKPERVATIAWANHEVPLALGIVPVGMSKATWGDDDNDGVLPWVEDKLEELGAETPVLFDETDGIDFEAVADTQPDVILASYSGLSQEEYDTLSKIAPVVAYPDTAWGTPYETMIEMNSEALGLKAEGEQLIDDLHTQTQDALDAKAALKDKKLLFAYLDASDLSQVGFYTSHDTRPGFFLDLGFTMPEIVTTSSADTEEFYVSVSAEKTESFDDVDLFITYGHDTTLAALQADPLLSKIPAIAAGHVAILQENTPLAASANPSPLSIPWGITDYFELLAAPLDK